MTELRSHHHHWTMEPTFQFAIILTSLILLKWLKKYLTRSLPLPPGPKGYPVIGNLLDMPSRTPWIKFAEWSKVYGIPCQLDSLLLRLTEL